jgi:hypothetical protein
VKGYEFLAITLMLLFAILANRLYQLKEERKRRGTAKGALPQAVAELHLHAAKTEPTSDQEVMYFHTLGFKTKKCNLDFNLSRLQPSFFELVTLGGTPLHPRYPKLKDPESVEQI